MAPSHRKQGNGGREADSTLVFSVVDPKLDKLTLPSSESTLTALRKKLLSCSMVLDDVGLTGFETFVNNLRGVSPLLFCKAKLFLLRTKRSLFLLSNKPPEELYEMSPGFMDIDFKKRCILHSAEDSRYLYMSLITTTDLDKLRGAISASMRQAMKPTLAPTEGQGVDLADFRGKLSGCQVIGGNAEGFDMKDFARDVKFAITFKDDNDSLYYFIIADPNEDMFRLYVNTPGMTRERIDSFRMNVQLRYGADFALLCQEG